MTDWYHVLNVYTLLSCTGRSCTKCAAGYTTPGVASNSSDACNVGLAGYELAPGNSTGPVLCPFGYYYRCVASSAEQSPIVPGTVNSNMSNSTVHCQGSIASGLPLP